MQSRPWVGGKDVKCGSLRPLADRPFHGPLENSLVVIVHPKYKARVHHHTQFMQASDRQPIVAIQVMALVVPSQVPLAERLKSHKEAAQAAGGRLLQQPWPQDRLHSAGGLPQAIHPAHPLEQRGREAGVSEEVIVQKVQVPAWQSAYFTKRTLHGLRVEGPPPIEEGLFVAEITAMRASA